VALGGEALEVAPGIHQHIVAVMRLLVIHNGRFTAAATLADRMRCQIRVAEMIPAPLRIVARLGAVIRGAARVSRLIARRMM
jgi:hypothetical protein